MGSEVKKYVANVDLDHQPLWSFKNDFNFVLKPANDGAVLISGLISSKQ